MMVVEISTGIIFGSMALLADGLHMASHAAALSISAFAYIFARRRVYDESFSFGTESKCVRRICRRDPIGHFCLVDDERKPSTPFAPVPLRLIKRLVSRS